MPARGPDLAATSKTRLAGDIGEGSGLPGQGGALASTSVPPCETHDEIVQRWRDFARSLEMERFARPTRPPSPVTDTPQQIAERCRVLADLPDRHLRVIA